MEVQDATTDSDSCTYYSLTKCDNKTVIFLHQSRHSKNSCFSLCKLDVTHVFCSLCPRSHGPVSIRAKSAWLIDGVLFNSALSAKQKIWNKLTKAIATDCGQLLVQSSGCWTTLANSPSCAGWGMRWTWVTFRCYPKMSSALPGPLSGGHLISWLMCNGSVSSWNSQLDLP